MPQFLSAILAMLPGFTFGSLLGYAAVAVPQVIDSSSLSALLSSPALLLSEKRINLFIVDCSQFFFQLMSPNSTGILIDIYQASWLGEILITICIPNQLNSKTKPVLNCFYVKSFGDFSLHLI